jgi:hypothetical protein
MTEERLARLQCIVLTVQSRSHGLGRRIITGSFFSHKTNGPALKYEVGIFIQTSDINWVNGPFKSGKWNGIKLYRRYLKGALGSGEMIEAYRGFGGGRDGEVSKHVLLTGRQPCEVERKSKSKA